MVDPATLPLRLGPFELRERIGEGGWGSVYGGVHAAFGEELPVAVKVLTGREGRGTLGAQALEREIEAVAALDHPHVVRILDHGVVTAEEGRGSGLTVGSPYFAMERLTGGTLSSKLGLLPWGTQRRVLLALLDALAHAHARGLIHRDVKPANVLLGKGYVKLADFGLAQAVQDPPEAQGPVAGTPGYMPPEQIRGHRRRLGPWTDLYALGCVAYELACRTARFTRGRTQAETLAEHLAGEPWPLEPREPVPEGLERWIDQLTAREPGERFRRAADAAAALRALGEPAVQRRSTRSSAPSMASHEAPTALGTTSHEASTAIVPAAGGDEGPTGEAPPQAPFAATWGGSTTSAATGGLGLFGLRRIPLVGREAERDALWAALSAAVREGQARAVVLRGAAGCGKSELARWFVQRADELGAAHAMVSTEDPRGGPTHGIGPMVERHLRLVGLTHRRVEQILLDELPGTGDPDSTAGDEAADLARVLRPGPEFGSGGFVAPADKIATLRRALERAAKVRPLIVWLDDAHASLTTLAFAAHALTLRDRLGPVLLVLTVEEGALAALPAAQTRVEALVRQEGVEALPLGPLDPADHHALVEQLLGLSSPLVARIEERTAGSPLFAVQLVGDWVQRGLLEPGPRGLRLRPGAEVPLPESLASSWRDRIDGLLTGLPPAAEEALELAAALGREVLESDWAQLAGPERRRLLARMVRRGLARPTESGWAFVHGLLPEAVLARAGARAAERHGRCADLLAGQPGVAPRRLATHLRAAGRNAEALGPLKLAIQETRSSRDHRLRWLLLDEYDAALAAAGLPEEHEAAQYGQLQRVRVLLLDHDVAGAERVVEQLEALAARHPDDATRARALQARANIDLRSGRLEEALPKLGEALELRRGLGDLAGVTTMLGMRVYALLRLGRPAEAERLIRERLTLAQQRAHVVDIAHSWATLLRATTMLGRFAEAEAIAGQALRHCRQTGLRSVEATVHNELGDLLREQGELARASEHYRWSERRFRELGYRGLMVPAWNLALTHLQAGRPDEARPGLDQALSFVRKSGARNLEGAVQLHLACCDAHAADWPAFDARLDAAESLLQETNFVDPDIVRFAQIAGDLAAEHGWQERAERVWAVAERARARLGGSGGEG